MSVFFWIKWEQFGSFPLEKPVSRRTTFLRKSCLWAEGDHLRGRDDGFLGGWLILFAFLFWDFGHCVVFSFVVLFV